MSLGLDLSAPLIETGNLRTEDRLDALAMALAQCRTGGEVMSLEADWVTAKWRLRKAEYTHAAARMCAARREELSREAQASGGASVDFWNLDPRR